MLNKIGNVGSEPLPTSCQQDEDDWVHLEVTTADGEEVSRQLAERKQHSRSVREVRRLRPEAEQLKNSKYRLQKGKLARECFQF